MYPALKLREEVSPSKPKGKSDAIFFLDMEQKEKTDIFYPSPPLSIFQVKKRRLCKKKTNNNNNKVPCQSLFYIWYGRIWTQNFLCICVPPCQWAGSFSFLGSRPACPLQILAHNGSSIPVLLKVWSTNCAGSANSLLPVHCVLSNNILSKHLEKFCNNLTSKSGHTKR